MGGGDDETSRSDDKDDETSWGTSWGSGTDWGSGTKSNNIGFDADGNACECPPSNPETSEPTLEPVPAPTLAPTPAPTPECPVCEMCSYSYSFGDEHDDYSWGSRTECSIKDKKKW